MIQTGCERELISPVDPTATSQTASQFAQTALSDLAAIAANADLLISLTQQTALQRHSQLTMAHQ